MSGSMVADLGFEPEVWLFLSLLGCLTLYFKFSRVWSIRNLDLLMLFVLAPGLLTLVQHPVTKPFAGFVYLFVGSALWLIRCLLDLGLTRRPLLEPNLNAAGLTCLAIGFLGLLLAETVSIPVNEGVARNPAEPGKQGEPPIESANSLNATVDRVLQSAPLPSALKPNPPQEIVKRVLAVLAHVALVAGLIAVGWWHFDRPIIGLAMATCYLILPYTRIALVDCGQIIPGALIVWAVAFFDRPSLTGILLGLASGWMPACLALLVLWAGFYQSRGLWRFVGIATGVVLTCVGLAHSIPGLAGWARALGARTLTVAGLLPGLDAPASGSFWSGLDDNFRLPVLIGYLAFVIVSTLWPARKNLGELIALSAAVLVASQFWYLDEGGTHIVLYLPLVLLMMFRPNLATKVLPTPEPRVRPAQEALHAGR